LIIPIALLWKTTNPCFNRFRYAMPKVRAQAALSKQPLKTDRRPNSAKADNLPDAERRIQILDEAATLFRERGFEATSMREIAARVGVSKPALYYWFPNKDDLLVGIILQALEQLCLRTEKAISRSDLPKERFQLFCDAHVRYIDSNPTFYGAAYVGFASLTKSSARDTAIAWRDRHEQNLRKILKAGVRSGDFQDIDVSLASRAMLSALAAVSRWYNPRGGLTAAEIASDYAALFLEGIDSKSRRKRTRSAPANGARVGT
jgi:TetR/AcrR family transcriptional regulator, cholesterol catabolism regulator